MRIFFASTWRFLALMIGSAVLLWALAAPSVDPPWSWDWDGSGYDPDCESYDFEVDEWTGSEQERERQAVALVECDRLIGMTEKQAIALLGPPKHWNEEDRLSFEIGDDDRLMDSYPQYMNLRLDRSGKIEHARLPGNL